MALTGQDQITPAAEFETYLFDQIGEVMKSYVLTVDGQFVGAATDRAALDEGYRALIRWCGKILRECGGAVASV